MEKHSAANKNSHKQNIKRSTDQLLDEGKKLVGDMYDDGLKKIETVQKEVKEQTDELLEKVRENPLKSILIAGGLGFLLSILLKK